METHFKHLWLIHFLNYSHKNQQVSLFFSLSLSLSLSHSTLTNILYNEDQWEDLEHRRKFILSFAEKAGFDPFQVKTWRTKLTRFRSYGVTNIKSHSSSATTLLISHEIKGARLLGKYENIQQMLIDTFPEQKQTSKPKPQYLY